MSNLKIHHIGYLVKKLDQAKQTFEALGYRIWSLIRLDTPTLALDRQKPSR